jgi:hypothetical protein
MGWESASTASVGELQMELRHCICTKLGEKGAGGRVKSFLVSLNGDAG